MNIIWFIGYGAICYFLGNVAILLALRIGRCIKEMRGSRAYDRELYDLCCDVSNMITRYNLHDKEQAVYDNAVSIMKNMEVI